MTTPMFGTDLSLPELPEVTDDTSGSYQSVATQFQVVRAKSLPKKLPDWYAPGYWTPQRMVDNQKKAGYGPYVIPYYSGTGLEAMFKEGLDRQLTQGIRSYSEVDGELRRLSQKYPDASPDLLVAMAFTGAPPDQLVMDADSREYAAMLAKDSQHAAMVGATAASAANGVNLDRTSTGRITLPNGDPYTVKQGDVIVRDRYGNIIDIVQAAATRRVEGQHDILSPLRTMSRFFFAVMGMPYEGITGTLRNVGQSLGDEKYGQALLDIFGYAPFVAGIRELLQGDEYMNPWEQTHAGQLILSIARGEAPHSGSGWFIDPESDIGRRQIEASAGAYTVQGQAFTLGRGVAGAIGSDPESTAYNLISGTVDFAAALLLDPTVWMAGLGLPSKGIRGISTLPKVGEAIRVARGAEEVKPLLIGVAKRQAAKQQAQALRAVRELTEQERHLADLESQLARTTGQRDKVDALNAQIFEARQQLPIAKAEAVAQAEELNRLKLISDLEEATKDVAANKAAADRARQAANMAEKDSALHSTRTQAREAAARLSAYEKLRAAGTRLEAATGLALGATVKLGAGKRAGEWTISNIDEAGNRVQVTSKGGRTRWLPRETVEGAPGMATTPPLHTMDDLSVAMLNMRELMSPEQLSAQADALHGFTDMPGLVTIDRPNTAAKRTGVTNVVLGMLDGLGQIAAWNGDRTANLVHAVDPVDNTVRAKVLAAVNDALTGEAPRKTPPPTMSGLFADALNKYLAEPANVAEELFGLLSDPTLDYGRLIDYLNAKGLLAYLDPVLKEAGFDGVGGLLRGQRGDWQGIWWGYSPDVVAYQARIGRLARDDDLALHVNREQGPSDVALVLDDAEGVAADIRAIQDEMDQLRQVEEQMLAELGAAGAKPGQITEGLAALQKRQRQLANDLSVAMKGLKVRPSYTPEALAAKIKELTAGRDAAAAEILRLETLAAREFSAVDTLSQIVERDLGKLTDQQRVVEGLRIRAGASASPDGWHLPDIGAARTFLFGGMFEGAVGKTGQAVIRALSRMDSPSQIHHLTHDKLPDEIVQELAQNARKGLDEMKLERPDLLVDQEDYNRLISQGMDPALARRSAKKLSPSQADEALRRWKEENVQVILASRVGLEIRAPLVGLGSKIPSATLGRELAQLGQDPGPRTAQVRDFSHPFINRMRALVPTAVKIDLADPADTARGLRMYLERAGLQPDEMYPILDLVWEFGEGADEGAQAARRNVLTQAFDAMRDHLINEGVNDLNLDQHTKDMLSQAIHQATRVFLGGEQDAQNYWRANLANMHVPISLLTSSGERIPIQGAQLESELAQGALWLPEPETFRQMVRRAGMMANGRANRISPAGWASRKGMEHPGLQSFGEATNRLFSDYWRSAMLIRGAYLLRNILEMQVRTFLVGGISALNNPLLFAGMALGPWLDRRNPDSFMRHMAGYDAYANDVYGYRFLGHVDDDNPDQVAAMQRLHSEYNTMMRTDTSLSDTRMFSGRRANKRGAPVWVGRDSPQFASAWAEELLLLRNDGMARVLAGAMPQNLADMIARNPNARQALITDYIFVGDTPITQGIHDVFRGAGPNYQRMLADRTALSDYLFGTGGNESNVQARLDAMTGKNDALLEFIRTGTVSKADGGPVKSAIGLTVNQLPTNPQEAHRKLRQVLTNYYQGNDAVTMPKDVRLWVSENSGDEIKWGTKVVDQFFKFSARIERNSSMGPEWRYVYWQTILDMQDDLTAAAKVALAKNMEESGLTLRRHGKPMGWLVDGHKLLKEGRPGAGALTLDDAHRIASSTATDEVARLFYDAHKRNQFWHSLRLMIPFGQAWWNTLSTWMRLGAQNPVKVYQAQKAFEAALSVGSNVVYEAADYALPADNKGWFEPPVNDRSAPWYDPRQGFLFYDDFGDLSFNVPGLGMALGTLANVLNVGTPGDIPIRGMEAGFKTSGLNLLFGGDSMLPGAGPIMQLLVSPWQNPIHNNDRLYQWVFPFGEDASGSNIIQAMVPAYARRLYSAIADPNSRYVMSNMASAMNFLVSEGTYDLSNASDQEQLHLDAIELAQQMATMTAIAQWILPTVPTRTWVGEAGDDSAKMGQRVGIAAAGSIFHDAYRPMYGLDFDQAAAAFYDDYGPAFLPALFGQDTGARRLTTQAGDIFRRYPQIPLSTYNDQLAMLWPEGGPEGDARLWQQSRLASRPLTPKEWFEQFNAYAYNTQRHRVEVKAQREAWPDGMRDAELANVEESWRGIKRGNITIPRAGEFLDTTYQMLQDFPELQAEDNSQVFLMLYQMRVKLQDKAEEAGLKRTSLDAKALKPQRTAYLAYLDQVETQYPQARRMVREFREEVL